jgi:hypothetical protein
MRVLPLEGPKDTVRLVAQGLSALEIPFQMPLQVLRLLQTHGGCSWAPLIQRS